MLLNPHWQFWSSSLPERLVKLNRVYIFGLWPTGRFTCLLLHAFHINTLFFNFFLHQNTCTVPSSASFQFPFSESCLSWRSISPNQKCFTYRNHAWFKYFNVWLQRHVVDFYISDFQSGLRALVKTGYGAKVTPYVDESVIVDINQSNRDMSQEFIRWLGERNLSSDDRTMQLKEG